MIRIIKKQFLVIILCIVLFFGALSVLFLNLKKNNQLDFLSLQNNYSYILTSNRPDDLFNSFEKYNSLNGILPAKEILKTKNLVDFLSAHGVNKNGLAWVFNDANFHQGAVVILKNKKITALSKPLSTDTSKVKKLILNDGTRWYLTDHKNTTFISQQAEGITPQNKNLTSVNESYAFDHHSGLSSVFINNNNRFWDDSSPLNTVKSISFDIKEHNNTLYLSGLSSQSNNPTANKSIQSIPLSSEVFNDAQTFNLESGLLTIAKTAQNSIVVSIAIPEGSISNIQSEHIKPTPGNTPAGNQDYNIFAQTDSPIIRGPYIFTNHIDKTLNTIVFDNNNYIYLYNQNGTLKWKKTFSDDIKGELFFVDKYQNGKTQFLWNSEDKLHLIDINGNEVDGFPYKLPEKAQKGISLLKLHGNPYPNIIYCDIKGAIRNITLSPAPARGWKNTTVEFPVTNRINYQYANNGHYIIVAGNNGEVVMLNENGEIRLRIKKSFVNNPSSKFYLNKTNSKGFLLTTNNTGDVIYIPRRGNIAKTQFAAFPEDHYFLYTDFDKDNKNDFIYITNKKITVYNRFKKIIYSAEITGGLFIDPRIIQHNKLSLLAISNAASSTVTLHSQDHKYEKIIIPCDNHFCYDKKSGSIFSAVGKKIYKTELQ